MEIEVAQWGELTYYLYQIPSTHQFEVIVTDEKKNKSVFNFDTGYEVKGNLSEEHRRMAKRMIQDFHEEFLDHWNKLMQR